MTKSEKSVLAHSVFMCVWQLVSKSRVLQLVWDKERCSVPLGAPWADGKVSGADVDSQSSQSAVLASCDAQQHYKLRQKVWTQYGTHLVWLFRLDWSWTQHKTEMLLWHRLWCHLYHTVWKLGLLLYFYITFRHWVSEIWVLFLTAQCYFRDIPGSRFEIAFSHFEKVSKLRLQLAELGMTHTHL